MCRGSDYCCDSPAARGPICLVQSLSNDSAGCSFFKDNNQIKDGTSPHWRRDSVELRTKGETLRTAALLRFYDLNRSLVGFIWNCRMANEIIIIII